MGRNHIGFWSLLGFELETSGSQSISVPTKQSPWEADKSLGCESFGEKNRYHFSVLSGDCFLTLNVIL